MKIYSYAMANGKGKYGIDPRIACITAPIWKHSSGSSVVTLKMRPQATPFTSLDTFMAAHSPRRFCQTRQRYLLKPLGFDKQISEAGFEPVVDDEKESRPKSRGPVNPKSIHHSNSYSFNKANRNNTCSPSTSTSAQDSSSSDQEHGSNRILPLGKCKINDEEFVNGCDGQTKFKPSSSFRPTQRLPFTFSRSASIPTSPRDTTDLIAIGTISLTSHRQPVAKPQSRWKTKSTLNLKGSRYPDPLSGAPPTFHARMTEIAQLEQETIKYEKSKKVKKKSPT